MPFLVARHENDDHAFVPTLGKKSQAVDLYRTLSFEGDDFLELGASLTDISSANALARLVEGPIESLNDLMSAETALQALLLSNAPQIFIPALKTRRSEGLIGYHRFDTGLRSQLAFELFEQPESWDFLVATELVAIEDEIIRDSTSRLSKLTNRRLDEITIADLRLDVGSETSPFAISDMLKVPAYFSDHQSIRARRGDGMAKRFYSSLNTSWNRATEGLPRVYCSFSLPPLISIVLHRSGSRDSIPQIIYELREELAEARRELIELNRIATYAGGSGEAEARAHLIDEAFSGILAESRMTAADKIRRVFIEIQELVAPITRYAAGFLSHNGISLEESFDLSGELLENLSKTRKVVDRTLISTAFTELVKTDTVQLLVREFLSESEILAIERSMDCS